MESKVPSEVVLYFSDGWNDCPEDILFLIFKHLDMRSLLNCMGVNRWWWDAVDQFAQHCKIWPKLAQEGMMNQGSTFRNKSSPSMSWRSLFINSLLWNQVYSTKIVWNKICSLDNIVSIHMFKDYLIVMHEHESEIKRKLYKITDTIQEITLCPQKENGFVNSESEEVSSSNRSAGKDLETDQIIAKIVKQEPFKKLTVFDDNCYYVIDDRNILRCYKWSPDKEEWEDLTLGRYYGCKASLSHIHVHCGDVYLFLKTGNVMKLHRLGRNFEKLYGLDVPQMPLEYYVRLFYFDMPVGKIEKVLSLDVPDYNSYSSGRQLMFHKFSAVVAVPSDKKFRITIQEESNSAVVECPGLTCATQHGEVLFLGYRDGRVDVWLTRHLMQNLDKPVLSLNVREFHPPSDDTKILNWNCTIVGLEVFEAKESHYLFIATQFHIDQLLLTYPDSVKNSLSCVETKTV